jgi:hypothetical protein
VAVSNRGQIEHVKICRTRNGIDLSVVIVLRPHQFNRYR